MALTQTQVSQLYVSIFNRASEGNGNTYWQSGADLATVATQMLATTDAATYFGSSLDTNEDFVKHIYLNTLNKTEADDAAGIAYWVNELNTGTSRGQMVANLVTAATEAANAGAAQDQFNNRVTVSNYMADTVAAAPSDYVTSTSFSSGLTVTSDAATVNTAKTAVNDIANPGQTFSLTTATNDVIVGTAGSDTITATTATDDATDIIIDNSTTDNDTLNWSATDATAALRVTKVENVNVTLANTAAKDVDAQNFTGITNLTVTRTDVSVGGSSITGNKAVSVTHVNGEEIAKVTTGTATTDATVSQADGTIANSKAGTTVNATTATGNVTVTGAATVTAGSGAAKTVTVVALNDASLTTENAKAVSITANSAGTILVDDSAGGQKITGAITIAAAAATSTTVDNATGGVTMTVGTTSTADTTIRVDNIDASGATITTGTGSSTAAEKQISIDLDGTAAATDVATISAAGYISLDTDGTGTADLVETLNLSGNGAAVTYVIPTNGGVAATFNLTGNQSVTVSAVAADWNVATLTDATTAGTTTAKITTGDNADLSNIAADVIQLADDGTSADYTVATGATIQIAADQTDIDIIGKTAGATVNVATADDTNASGATIEITNGTFTASTYVQTLNLDATVGKFTATTTVLDVAGTDATTLNISGTKAVTLGTTSAKTINAANLTAALSATLNGAAAATSVTGGTGDDVLVFNDTNSSTTVYTVDAGNGANNITITNAKVASSFATGSGDDAVTVTSVAAYVVSTGGGNDTVTINGDIDSILAMGEGTSDKVVFAAAQDLTTGGANDNFVMTGVEVVDISGISGTAKITAAAFANDNAFRIDGTTLATDIFHVINTSTTAGATIDASNITFESTQAASLYLQGAMSGATTVMTDIITGSSKDDVIIATTGGDTIDGGAGTDTINLSALDAVNNVEGTGTGTTTGVVINLSTSAITNTAILAATGDYTADAVTSVAAGTMAYLFDASASTNSSKTSSITGIENVIGSDLGDYIKGSTAGNIIIGGDGVDTIVLGAGADKVVLSNDAAGNQSVISGFSIASDKIGIDESEFATINFAGTGAGTATGTALVAADYNEIAAAGTLVADKLNIITTAAGYADYDTAFAAVTASAAGELIVGFYNSATSKFELYFDADGSDNSGEVLIAQIDITGANVTTLSEANFLLF